MKTVAKNLVIVGYYVMYYSWIFAAVIGLLYATVNVLGGIIIGVLLALKYFIFGMAFTMMGRLWFEKDEFGAIIDELDEKRKGKNDK